MSVVLHNRDLASLVPRRAADRLRAFRREVEKALKGRVTGVTLFGSRARGDAGRDSDYDVAVFVADLNDRRAVDHLLSDIAYPHVLSGFHIQPVSVPADFLDDPLSGGLALSIRRDGLMIS
jgi:hypothetical protein